MWGIEPFASLEEHAQLAMRRGELDLLLLRIIDVNCDVKCRLAVLVDHRFRLLKVWVSHELFERHDMGAVRRTMDSGATVIVDLADVGTGADEH